MFEEEISPEELFRQFFGGGMGGGGFGGGPFGGFGAYKGDSLTIFIQQLTRTNRRQRFRLQHGRRTWSQDTPNGRRRSPKKTTQPRKPTTSITYGRTTVSPATASTIHHPSPVITLLRRRTNIPNRSFRKRCTADSKTRHHETQSRLLRQPQRHRRLLAPELERSVQPRRNQLRPKTRDTMRMGKNAQTTSVPRSARLLEQRPGQVASRGRYGYACVQETARLGLPY